MHVLSFISTVLVPPRQVDAQTHPHTTNTRSHHIIGMHATSGLCCQHDNKQLSAAADNSTDQHGNKAAIQLTIQISITMKNPAVALYLQSQHETAAWLYLHAADS